jgi:hypothetical protein
MKSLNWAAEIHPTCREAIGDDRFDRTGILFVTVPYFLVESVFDTDTSALLILDFKIFLNLTFLSFKKL